MYLLLLITNKSTNKKPSMTKTNIQNFLNNSCLIEVVFLIYKNMFCSHSHICLDFNIDRYRFN